MLEPMIVEMKVNAPRSSFSRSDQKELKQKLIHSVKRERKAATREIKKDTVFLARQKLSETLKRWVVGVVVNIRCGLPIQ